MNKLFILSICAVLSANCFDQAGASDSCSAGSLFPLDFSRRMGFLEEANSSVSDSTDQRALRRLAAELSRIRVAANVLTRTQDCTRGLGGNVRNLELDIIQALKSGNKNLAIRYASKNKAAYIREQPRDNSQQVKFNKAVLDGTLEEVVSLLEEDISSGSNQINIVDSSCGYGSCNRILSSVVDASASNKDRTEKVLYLISKYGQDQKDVIFRSLQGSVYCGTSSLGRNIFYYMYREQKSGRSIHPVIISFYEEYCKFNNHSGLDGDYDEALLFQKDLRFKRIFDIIFKYDAGFRDFVSKPRPRM